MSSNATKSNENAPAYAITTTSATPAAIAAATRRPDQASPLPTNVAAGSNDTIATVQGQGITAGEYRRTYEAQLQAYRTAYGANMSEQLLKQLGIDQQILQQMVDEMAALAEADRLGIDVNNEEIRQKIAAARG